VIKKSTLRIFFNFLSTSHATTPRVIARRGREDLNGGEEIGETEGIEGPCDGFLIVRKISREGRRNRVKMADVYDGRTFVIRTMNSIFRTGGIASRPLGGTVDCMSPK